MKEEEACRRLRELFSQAVERNDANALLLSGGLDTSVLAALSRDSTAALTVAMTRTRAPDLEYAKTIAQKFHFEHHRILISEDEALERIPEVISVVKNFDPALPNDVTIYIALQKAQELGIHSVMTGDGADELFAGYSYMHELSPGKLNTYIKKISSTMYFSSSKLGDALGVTIKQPYCDKEVVEFALDIPPHLKVREQAGRRYGKWIVRKAFESDLGKLAWRQKEPIEFGSGTTALREVIRAKISDAEFSTKKRKYGMEFMNKEHLFFYEIYSEVVGEIPKPKEGLRVCPLCKAELPEDQFHCYFCGFSYPLNFLMKEH
jgi:asparagine synthase (glutamine-hydrolysing)